MSKNLFSKTYEVNGRTYTDNLPTNARIMFTKEQYIEYEQQKEEIERLKESEEYHRKGYAELHKRIDRAIEYIESEKIFNDIEVARVIVRYEKTLLDILRGKDNE